jgi:hypothetical protein
MNLFNIPKTKKKSMTTKDKLLIEQYNQCITQGGCLKVKGVTKELNKGFSDTLLFSPKQNSLF